MLSYILICVLFYLIGSFPTAYLLIRFKYNKNILNEGTGNVGARNTLDITGSKKDGIIVLIIDFLKGFIPVLWFLSINVSQPEILIIPALCLLIGHNYSVWLKFKGGRGLATAAGIMVAVNFTLVILWLIFYFVISKIIKSIHVSAVIALIVLPVSIIFLQNYVLKFNHSGLNGVNDPFRFLFAFCSSVCIIILLKHIQPVIDVIKNKKENNILNKKN